MVATLDAQARPVAAIREPETDSAITVDTRLSASRSGHERCGFADTVRDELTGAESASGGAHSSRFLSPISGKIIRNWPVSVADMRRRSFLALGGSLAAATVAGCLQQSADRPEFEDGVDSPGAPLGEQADDSAYPDYFDDVVGYDQIDLAVADVYLEPSARETSRGEPTSFTLYNESDRDLNTNFYDWRVAKRVDDRWFHIAPDGVPLPLHGIEAGDSHEWTLVPADRGTEDGTPVSQVQGTSDLAVPAMGGGRYLFGAFAYFSSESYDAESAYVVRFDLDADPLSLTPTDSVQGARWEGDTLVVQSGRGDPDGEYSRRGAYEVTRVDDPSGEAPRTITEQVVRDDQLRDALALAQANDADRVSLREYNSTTPLFGVDGPELYAYDGDVWEVTAREVGSCGCGSGSN